MVERLYSRDKFLAGEIYYYVFQSIDDLGTLEHERTDLILSQQITSKIFSTNL